MKHLLILFASVAILSGCSKKERTNPDDLITIKKYIYLNKITCDTVFTFYIPNAFTPNADNINEFWEPKSNYLDSSQYHIDIIDKRGKVVFKSDTPAKFDGEGKNGQLVAQQTLCYNIHAKDKTGNSYKFKGQFVVIK
jgi:gliding motility-associated-like protein